MNQKTINNIIGKKAFVKTRTCFFPHIFTAVALVKSLPHKQQKVVAFRNTDEEGPIYITAPAHLFGY